MQKFLSTAGQLITVSEGRVSMTNNAGVQLNLGNAHKDLNLGAADRRKAVHAATLLGLAALNAISVYPFRAA